jgi:hypothetical protein
MTKFKLGEIVGVRRIPNWDNSENIPVGGYAEIVRLNQYIGLPIYANIIVWPESRIASDVGNPGPFQFNFSDLFKLDADTQDAVRAYHVLIGERVVYVPDGWPKVTVDG